MTIVIQGHVEKLETGMPGQVEVTIRLEAAVCRTSITLAVPMSLVQHYPPGMQISLTIYPVPKQDSKERK